MKVEKIKAVIQKYMDSEQLPTPPTEIVVPETPAPAAAPAKKAGKK
jgi:hypothetical protein